MPDDAHVAIHPHCGACGRLFRNGEKITAVICPHGKNIHLDAGRFKGGPRITPPYAGRFEHAPCITAPLWRHLHYIFCQKWPCHDCRVGSGESATCHNDCLDFWTRKAAKADASIFWRAATWRYPWAQSHALLLPPRKENNLDAFMRLASEVCEFPSITRLPAELAMMVADLCGSDHLLWRYAPIAQFLEGQTQTKKAVQKVPVTQVQSWHRGGEAKVSRTRRDPGFIQLVFDAQGLEAIHRITKPRTDLSNLSRDRLYMTEQTGSLSEMTVQLQFGLGRLITSNTHDLAFWNSPNSPRRLPWAPDYLEFNQPGIEFNPPDRPCFAQAQASLDQPPRRYTKINLHDCSGLTFFVSKTEVWAIHSHTKESPNAIETFERLRPTIRGEVCWYYVPLANVEILAVGFRSPALGHIGHSAIGPGISPCLLVELSSGPVFPGPWQSGLVMDDKFPVARGQPLVCEYDHPEMGISRISIPGSLMSRSYPPVVRSEDTWLSRAICLSSAPLEGVRSMVVYREDLVFCRGLILEYVDGTQRALGECRVGQDLADTYDWPTGICFGNVTEMGPGVRDVVYLEVATRLQPLVLGGMPQQPRPVTPMRGTMTFWFSVHERRVFVG